MKNKIIKFLILIAVFAIDPFTIAALLSLAGTAASAKANSDANKSRKRAILQQQENQDDFSREAQKRIIKTTDEFAPEQEEQRLETRDADNLDVLTRIANVNSPARTARPDIGGKVSSAFGGESTKRKIGTANKAVTRNKELSRFLSPSQNGAIDKSRILGDLSSRLGQTRSFQRGQTRADQHKIDSIVPSGGLMTLSAVLKGLGMAAGATGGFGLASAPGAITPTALVNSGATSIAPSAATPFLLP